MNASAYLHFEGQCEEAFSFYARAFPGGALTLLRWADAPGGNIPPGMDRLIMHASLQVGSSTIMGSDPPPGRYTPPTGFGVVLGVDSDAEAERIFMALCEGGSVTMDMGETFFAHRFGMLTDRFGIPWMVVHAKS